MLVPLRLYKVSSMVITVSNTFPYLININQLYRKFKTFAYSHQRNLPPFKVDIFKVNKIKKKKFLEQTFRLFTPAEVIFFQS